VFTDSSTDAASNYENCYGYQITVTGSGNSLTTTPNYYGVLSTADSATAPAFVATPGYDLATGLGSPNVYALVNAPLWSPLSITTTALAPGVVGTAYSQTLAASGRVAPYTWSVTAGSLPAGLTLASASGVISGTPTAAGTATFTVQVADAESTPATATASFSLTVAPAAAKVPSTTVLSASPASVGTGVSVTFTATVSGAGGVPTGTVAFYNGTASLGTGTLANGVATLITSFSATGTATITAVYGGDTIFLGSTSQPFTETIATPGFTMTVNPASLSIPFSGTGTVTVTVTPQGGFTGPVNFSCGSLPKFFSCSFASSSISLSSSGAAVNNTLTINTAVVPMASAFLLAPFALLLAAGPRRRARILFFACFVSIAAMSGCGRGDHQAPLGNYSVPITVSSTAAASQTVTLAVTVE
jgi:hypothetical protein